ncbi:MAG: acryloyl-CoA reductase [Bacteroidetes bacterium]|jgi:acrylyl-CoA reductase (NADPH)|nr:acryloyl-CoA reductase [Bacteroidota bacterium]
MFDALVLDSQDDAVTAAVQSLEDTQLPDEEVLVDVLYSSLNYKDGLAVTGEGKIVRGDYPFVPGIDLVGRVVDGGLSDVEEGAVVIQTGGGLGESTWGGYSQRQRVAPTWLVPLPDDLTPLESMVVGTAGFTAMLSVMALEHEGLQPGDGEVVVTGASGGVGSVAVALLARRGYDVVASSGSEDAYDYLHELGALRIVGRDAFAGGPSRPLESAQWAGAVDTVGGDTLAALIPQMDRHASIAACGNAGGAALSTTVFPFILRGVNLLGIDSNTATLKHRREAWSQIAQLPNDVLSQIHAATIALGEVPAWSRKILQGDVRGRVVVDVNA